jgi:hypothetical protein
MNIPWGVRPSGDTSGRWEGGKRLAHKGTSLGTYVCVYSSHISMRSVATSLQVMRSENSANIHLARLRCLNLEAGVQPQSNPYVTCGVHRVTGIDCSASATVLHTELSNKNKLRGP